MACPFVGVKPVQKGTVCRPMTSCDAGEPLRSPPAVKLPPPLKVQVVPEHDTPEPEKVKAPVVVLMLETPNPPSELMITLPPVLDKTIPVPATRFKTF